LGEVVAAGSDLEREFGHFQRDVFGQWVLVPESVRRRAWVILAKPASPWAADMATSLFEHHMEMNMWLLDWHIVWCRFFTAPPFMESFLPSALSCKDAFMHS
jgi:hypothetical protein